MLGAPWLTPLKQALPLLFVEPRPWPQTLDQNFSILPGSHFTKCNQQCTHNCNTAPMSCAVHRKIKNHQPQRLELALAGKTHIKTLVVTMHDFTSNPNDSQSRDKRSGDKQRNSKQIAAANRIRKTWLHSCLVTDVSILATSVWQTDRRHLCTKRQKFTKPIGTSPSHIRLQTTERRERKKSCRTYRRHNVRKQEDSETVSSRPTERQARYPTAEDPLCPK